MSIICPTILATDSHEYREQMERVLPFAERIQIDVMDGIFADKKSLPLSEVWIPEGVIADIHVMFKNPAEYIDTFKALQPNMVIVHAESDCDIPLFASQLREAGIKTGVAVLSSTPVTDIEYVLPHVQHVLIFSGDLGNFGGTADLELAQKATAVKTLNHYLEIGWDGGANNDNCLQLAQAGIDVINVGSAIQKSPDPQSTYATMRAKVTS